MRHVGWPRTAVVALLTAAIMGVAGAGGAASARTCSPPGARPLAADREARVYFLGGRGNHILASPARLYACLRGSQRITLLGTVDARQRVGPALLNGPMLALSWQFMGVDTLSSEVEVFDLGRGRPLHREAATGPVLAPESAVLVHALALDGAGNLAWLASQASIVRGSTRYEVHRVNGAGASLLDAGPAIVPGSLRRHGETVAWRNGTTRRTAPLAGASR